MEKIYTIPVNEAFDEVSQNPECGCPLCLLYNRLEENEIELILGASMMEPDIRIKTNEQGFCARHYKIMLGRRRMLGVALMLESHLSEVGALIEKSAPAVRRRASKPISELECDCYVCRRIEKNLGGMTDTAVHLWKSDSDFREKFKRAPCFCLPHYRLLLDFAEDRLQKKLFSEFCGEARAIEERYMSRLSEDVSWYCKKFDYRYDKEPWYNSKDSVPRAVKFLSGDIKYE